jgi:hypothetical protein
MSWAGHVILIGDVQSEDKVLAGKSEGKRPLGRQRSKCEVIIKIDFGKIVCERVSRCSCFRIAANEVIA